MSLKRRAIIDALLQQSPRDCLLIAALGHISREVHALSTSQRERCFFNLGAMGSVVPLALGVALSQPDRRVLAIEGDGSLLMNLGALATLQRYGAGNVRVVVMDNRCYESTGGQPSQAEGLRLELLGTAAGLAARRAIDLEDVAQFASFQEGPATPSMLVVDVERGSPQPRISECPIEMALRFGRFLERSARSEPSALARVPDAGSEREIR